MGRVSVGLGIMACVTEVYGVSFDDSPQNIHFAGHSHILVRGVRNIVLQINDSLVDLSVDQNSGYCEGGKANKQQ
ncbi:hypothetical protein DM30_15600 [Brucella abortus]|nr:hypothetical protein DM30_15600 [Brucella abortus]ALF31788.1 hypothetical protein NL70_15570 [Brucella abortus 104M]KFH24430.1 hypothetical protein IB63_02690 [Brucella abortus 544]KOC78549.1 hypothetical protein AK971_10890 [Brucella abortus]